MAYVPGRTAGRRRQATAAIPSLHAVTIRQTAAGADRGQPKTAKTKNFTKSGGKSFANDRKLAKIATFLYILGQYGKESPPAAGTFLAKSGVNDRHRHHLHAPGRQPGGEVYKSEGRSLLSLLRNSPPRPNVLHTGSNIRAISLSPPRPHVPLSGTPIRASHASYRQVRGRGGGFETGSKKRNGQKAEVEK